MPYGVSTMVFAHLDLEAALRRIASAGFDRIEINSEPPHLCSGAYDPLVVRGWLDELGLRAPVGHGLFDHQAPNAAALSTLQPIVAHSLRSRSADRYWRTPTPGIKGRVVNRRAPPGPP